MFHVAFLPLMLGAVADEPVFLTEKQQTQAVTVPGVPLVHTAQVSLPECGNTRGETRALLEHMRALARTFGRGATLVKLNIVATTPKAAQAVREVLAQDTTPNPPAVSLVVGRFNWPGTVAMDAVIAAPGHAAKERQLGKEIPRQATLGAPWGVLPAGPRVYISGQAEKGKDHAEATRLTLDSLVKTLQWLGADTKDVVQVKIFQTQPDQTGEVMAQVAETFGAAHIPPVVFVEWQSTLPVEIELVAQVPPLPENAPAIEYLTPPGMTASPVYARVTRLAPGPVIYTTGLSARQPGNGAEEVTDVFEQLQGILTKTGSDLKHLAKATYFVSGNDASAKLNELRPKYYDPQRPPAASKAMVTGVNLPDRTLHLDIIAIPVPKK